MVLYAAADEELSSGNVSKKKTLCDGGRVNKPKHKEQHG